MSTAQRTINKRYRVKKPLGQGGMGEVFLVEDLFAEPRKLLALKFLALAAEERVDVVQWFKQEFHTLAGLHHPYLAQVFDFSRDGATQQPFYTSEYVEGKDLFAATRYEPPERTLGVLTQVCQALDYVHTKGVLHNDLKTSNILVEENTHHPKILDFGLSYFLYGRNVAVGAKSQNNRVFRGTMSYAAPELIRGEPPSFQTDLFALGMVFYKVLAGRLPQSSRTGAEIARQNLEASFPPPRKFNPDISKPLEELIVHLIAKDPADRPSSAAEAEAALAAALGRSPAARRGEESVGYAQSAGLVARERAFLKIQSYVRNRIPRLSQGEATEVAQMDDPTLATLPSGTLSEYDALREGQGFVIIEGKAGLGKTQILKTLRHHYQLLETPFVTIDCAGALPVFTPIRRAIREVASHLPRESKSVTEFAALLSYLEDVEGKARREFEDADRTGFFLRVIEFFKASFREAAYVLAFDGVDTADVLTVGFLQHLSRAQRQGAAREFPPVVLALRQKHEGLTWLEKRGQTWVTLEALTQKQTHLLLQKVFVGTPVPVKFSQTIYERCDGNPFFVQEVLRDLISREMLARRQGRWMLAEFDLKDLVIPPTLGDLLLERYERLPALHRRVLQAASLWNESFTLEIMESLVQEVAPSLSKVLADLQSRDLLSAQEGQGLSFTQAFFRELVEKNIAPDDSRPLHARSAELLEKQDPHAYERLALHFEGAGALEEALPYLLKAARQCRQFFAHDRSVDLYRRALAIARGDATKLAEEVAALGGLAETLWQIGKRANALESCEALLARSTPKSSSEERTLALRLMGIAQRTRGDYDGAVKIFRQALDELGNRMPHARATLCAKIAYAFQQQGRNDQAQQWITQALSLVKREEEFVASAVPVLLELAPILTHAGDHAEGKRLYEAALVLAEKEKDQSGASSALNSLGAMAAMQGNYVEAQSMLERNLAVCRKMGDAGQTYLCLDNLGKVQYVQGRYRDAAESLREALELARSLNDLAFMASTLVATAQLETDRANYGLADRLLSEAEVIYADLKQTRGVQRAQQARAAWLLAVGRLQEARDLAESVLDSVKDADIGAFLGLIGAEAAILLEDRRGGETLLVQAIKTLGDGASVDLKLRFGLIEGRYLLATGQIELLEERLKKLIYWKGEATHSISKEELTLLQLRVKERAGKDVREDAIRLTREVMNLESPELLWQAHQFLAEQESKTKQDWKASESLKHAQEIFQQIALDIGGEGTKVYLADPRKQKVLERLREISQSSEYANQELKSVQDLNQSLFRLLAINRQLASGWQNRERLLDYLLDTALELTGGQRGFVFLKGAGKEGSIAAARNRAKHRDWEPEKEFSASIVNEVFQTSRSKKVLNALGDPEFQASKSVRALALRSVLCVPMRMKGQTLGVIYIDHDKVQDAFSAASVDLLGALADQAILALHQTEKFSQIMNEVEETSSELQRAQVVIQQQNKALEWKYSYARIVGGKAQAMQRVFSLLDRVIPFDSNVLIQGESGTGKELVAQAIHYNGPRKDKPFMSINCAGLNANLLESELFGHLKGSFTGAEMDRKGLLVVADGGTVFLDEIADMPLELQAKILRTLQDREVRPIGSGKIFEVDVRFIAASNKPLPEQVEQGMFREDLYYRLNVVQIDLPPLRERMDDLDMLIDAFVKELSMKKDGRGRSLTARARKALHQYSWPGNVRELYNTLEGLIAVQSQTKIDVRHLPEFLRDVGERGEGGVLALERAKEKFFKSYLENVLQNTNGNVSEAAKKAGISRQNYYQLMKKYHVKGE